MKKILIAATLIASVQQLHAQISFDPEIGVNLSTASFTTTDVNNPIVEKTGSKVGFRLGCFVDVPLVKSLSIQPGMFYSMRGYKTSYDSVVASSPYTYRFKMSLGYLEFPVNVKYNCSLGEAGSFFVAAGPYLGVAMSGHAHKTESWEGSTQTEDADLTFGSDPGNIKSFDFGFNGAIGYETPLGIYLKIQYGHGLNNLLQAGAASLHNKGFAFTFGYDIKTVPKKKSVAKNSGI
jgi:hypothetical protein